MDNTINADITIDINEKNIVIINFLNTCGVSCNNLNELDGTILYRNNYIFSNNYEKIKPSICELKKYLSSSVYTSLHSDADKKQRFPLVNLIRQILNSINYKLVPKRISDGYTSDGIKKYKRIFIIQKI
jgi:hypothetical protein